MTSHDTAERAEAIASEITDLHIRASAIDGELWLHAWTAPGPDAELVGRVYRPMPVLDDDIREMVEEAITPPARTGNVAR